jgi:MEMO1 family protein
MFDKNHIYGGIVAHHLSVCEEQIENFFNKISLGKNKKYDLVVLLGPNHFNAGSNEIQTSLPEYDTVHGKLKVDSEIIDRLAKRSLLHLMDQQIFLKDHSITSLVPFIKKYFPHSSFLPIILKNGVSRHKCNNLAQKLLKLAEKRKIIVLASVDFSHYLSQEAAYFHDLISIDSISSFDFQKISELELDSWPSIYTLLKYLSIQSAQKMTLIDRTDSNKIKHSQEKTVVSYVFSYFSKGKPIVKKSDSVLCLGNIHSSRLKCYDFSNNRRFFYSVDFLISNIEGNYQEIIDNGNSCHSLLAEQLFKNRICPIKDGSIINWRDLGSDIEYLTAENVRYLQEFEHGGNYFIKKLNYGKLGCLFIDFFEKKELVNYNLLIKQLKTKADYLMAYVYWPDGFSLENAKKTAHYLIEKGIDVVLGNYKECTKCEIYNDKLIVYSLKEFRSYDHFEDLSWQSAVGLVFEGKGKFKYQIFKKIC